MTTLNKCEYVSLCHSTILSSTWNLVDIDSLRLGNVPNSWSRQGFSTSTDLITWRCSCDLIFDLILNWNLIRLERLRCLQRRGWFSRLNFFGTLPLFFDLDDDVTDSNDIIVTVIHCCDFSSCRRWNLGDKLICEYFAQVLILYNDFIVSKSEFDSNKTSYLFNFVANLDKKFLYCGLLRSFAKIRQLHINRCEIAA